MRTQAEWKVEEGPKKSQIIITSIPFGVNKGTLEAAIGANYPNMSVISLAVGKGRDFAWNGAIDALRYNASIYDFEPFGVFTSAA